MAALDQILKYLDKPEVSEVILQSGKAITARVHGLLQPLSAAPLAQATLDMLLTHTELTLLKGTGQAERLRVNGKPYLITIARRPGVTMVRIEMEGKPVESPPARPAPTAAERSEPPRAAGAPISPRMAPTERTSPSARLPTTQAERTSPPVTMQAERTSPPVTMQAERTPPPVIMQAERTSPPVTMQAERTSPPVIMQAERTSPPAAAPALVTPAPTLAPRTPAPVVTSPAHAAAVTPAPAPQAPAVELLQPWGPSRFQPRFDPMMVQLLQAARAQNASDVHIIANRPVRFRCVGALAPQGEAIDDNTVARLLFPLLDPRSADQLQRLGYADFAFDAPGAGRIRANVNQTKAGLKGCFRLVVERPPTLKELGLPEELAKVTTYHQGLAVVSGPTGHGKTTTLSALVDLINGHKADHIITVEDPVEIVYPVRKAVISQRQVGAHTDSFHAALKGALREDPDVIVIGELRDLETVEMALSAAETGHLVIATMSTPSGAKTIDRLIDLFPPEDQNQVRATLAGALKIVASQRLIPSADGTHLVAIAELITGNVPLWNLIRDDKLFQLPSLLQRGRAFGMIRFEDSLKQQVQAGKVSMETAMRFVSDPRLLRDEPDATPQSSFKPRAVKPESDTEGEAKPKRGLFGR